jgi:hypothetical protein
METKIVLTEKERELIETLRNLKNSKHNYSIRLEEYARELFDTILDEIRN